MAANTIAYALRNNQEFSTPKTTNDPFWNPIYLHHLQHPNYIQGIEDVLINEPHYHYTPLPEFKKEWEGKNVIFNGYYQSWRYIEDMRSEILTLFNFDWELQPIISLHARFGDYLIIAGKHILVDEPYITKAIKYIKERTGIERVKVFSDDLHYFKKNFGHLYDFEYSTNTNEIDDLVEISCCHSQIGSSSTFSWWGGYLNRNPDKIVVTQREWFQEGWMNMNTKDVIPTEWVKI